MRIIAGILALLIAPLANASLVRFDVATDFTGVPFNTWLGQGPAPTSVELSFTIDTLTAQSSLFAFGGPNPGDPCVQSFRVAGLQASNINAITNTCATLWSAQSGTVSVGGDNPGGQCPSGFFGLLNLTDGTTSYAGSPDILAPFSSQAELFGSPDPLGQFFASFMGFSGSGAFTGDFGSMRGAILPSSSVADVPEPSSLALFGAGLLAVVFRFRRKPLLH
jgi:hypothetical protein